MHICIVTTEYLPGPGGGVATYTAIISKLLVNAGHTVTVVVKQEGADCPWHTSETERLKIIPVPMINEASGISIWDDPDLYANEMIHLRSFTGVFANKVAKLLPKIHAKTPFDIVLSQDVEAPTYILQNERLLFNVMADVPFVVFIHSPHRQIQLFNEGSLYHRNEYHRVLYEEQSMALADGLIAASEYMKVQMLEQMGFANEAIKVIPLPLGKIPKISGGKLQKSSQQKSLQRVVYAGRIEPRKGVDVLIRAFVQIAPDYPEVELELIGNDTQHPALGKPCSEVLLKKIPKDLRNRIHFAGATQRASIWDRYRSAEVGVVPSYWEPFSFTCQEMMACGLPVVATVEGGMAEMIENNKQGWLCAGGDATALAESLKSALNAPREKRQAMGKAARTRILDYCDNTKVLDNTLKYFESIISTNRRQFQQNRRFPIPANLPFGDHPLKAPHPASHYGIPARIESVAAIVTCYNLGQYLDDCIGSLLAQKRIIPDIYVVNDGSTEKETLAVLDRLRNRPCIQVLDYVNGGLPIARQRGATVALAAGHTALMFIDADDTIEASYLSKAVEILNRHPEAGAVNAWTHTHGLMHTYWIPPHSQFPLLMAECLSTPAAVIRKEAYLAAGGVSSAMKYAYEDWEFWIALCKTGYALLTIPEPLLRYRMREGSMSQEYRFATREHGRREILRRHADIHQRFANEIQLLTEGYIYFEQAKFHSIQTSWHSADGYSKESDAPKPKHKKVPLDKKIYRYFKRKLDCLKAK